MTAYLAKNPGTHTQTRSAILQEHQADGELLGIVNMHIATLASSLRMAHK